MLCFDAQCTYHVGHTLQLLVAHTPMPVTIIIDYHIHSNGGETGMRAQDDCCQLITFTATRDKSANNICPKKQQRERMKVTRFCFCKLRN